MRSGQDWPRQWLPYTWQTPNVTFPELSRIFHKSWSNGKIGNDLKCIILLTLWDSWMLVFDLSVADMSRCPVALSSCCPQLEAWHLSPDKDLRTTVRQTNCCWQWSNVICCAAGFISREIPFSILLSLLPLLSLMSFLSFLFSMLSMMN